MGRIDEDWQTVAAAHRRKQLEAIPPTWRLDDKTLSKLRGDTTPDTGRLIKLQAAKNSGVLSDSEVYITETYTAKQLLELMAEGKLKALDVTRAFSKRAAIAQQLTSCLTEIFFEEGLERAKWLDQYYEKHGRVIGPLHGLPISLKDSFVVPGHHATVGYIEFLRRPVPETASTLVDMLLNAGAVLYCKTNVPQTMMTADSENNVFGRTLNPHNTNLTAGGSSGGEGALVAFRGSVLGVGTDIAGSIRIPSLCCGVYGFKPTSGRIPFKGQSFCPFPRLRLPGGIDPVAGPMATSVEDLSLFMKTIIGTQPWRLDPAVPHIPWRTIKPADKLIVGQLPEDEIFKLHPPVRRALERACAVLEKAGHTVVRLPSDASRSVALGASIAFQYFGMGSPSLSALEEEIGEPLVSSVAKGVHPFHSIPPPVCEKLGALEKFSAWGFARNAYADSWRRTWVEHNLHVLLAPGAISTAVPHDTYGNPVYTLIWNLLDYPAAIMPFGTSSCHKDSGFEKGNAPFDADYDPEDLDGMPCAIQVITPRFQDEECLDSLRIIDNTLRPQ